jgi:hypothetical protein
VYLHFPGLHPVDIVHPVIKTIVMKHPVILNTLVMKKISGKKKVTFLCSWVDQAPKWKVQILSLLAHLMRQVMVMYRLGCVWTTVW